MSNHLGVVIAACIPGVPTAALGSLASLIPLIPFGFALAGVLIISTNAYPARRVCSWWNCGMKLTKASVVFARRVASVVRLHF